MAKGDLDKLTLSVKGSGGYDAGERVLVQFFGRVALASPEKMIPAEGVSNPSYWRCDGEAYRFSSLTELLQWVEKALITNNITLPTEGGPSS